MHSDSPNPEPARGFKPSRFMRELRPYLYSDSSARTEYALTREVLSHHLDTLTNQKDESAFEKFAHRLVEKFIAPNLRPQTGPTGGGDGKTDAETYPVTSGVALRWYVPSAAPAQERFAFAFSAKKKWREKIKADVASIVGTNRGYPKIYFVTNQFVPGVKSAEVQDELERLHGVPVIILDRMWLLDRVFEHDSMDIAVKVLGVGSERTEGVTGPEDHKRLSKLSALDKVLDDASTYDGTPHALVSDCHETALLARGLGKPRSEIDGRFQRAIRLAKHHGLPKLEVAIHYDWAWTSCFWFDDAITLCAQYDEVERLIGASDVAEELERLSNLLSVIRNAVAAGALTRDEAKLDQRTTSLLAGLAKAQSDTSRPNNALHARALALMAHVVQRTSESNPDDGSIPVFDDLWNEFREVIQKSDGLGTFPFEQIAELLTAAGEFVPESEAFDQLYETLTDKIAARRSEGEAAERNATRGFQKLEKGLPYEAIRWFGRSCNLLIKAEYEDELIRALLGSSAAYQMVGLPWAARNFAFAATAQLLRDFVQTEALATINPLPLKVLFETELQLGRVPYVLNAYYLEMMIRGARASSDEARERLGKSQLDRSMALGGLLIKTPFEQLPKVAQLPDALERLGLFSCRASLLFLMQDEALLRADGAIPANETSENVLEFFDRLKEMGDKGIAARVPDYMLDERVELRSRVLGCEINISCDNNLVSISVGEAILGSLEALLATSLKLRILPHRDRLFLTIDPRDEHDLCPELFFSDNQGKRVGKITHAWMLKCKSYEEGKIFPGWLRDAVIQTFTEFAVPADFEKWGDAVLGDENGFGRALTFSNVPNSTGLIHGYKQKTLTIEEWIDESDAKHKVTRATSWRSRSVDASTKMKRPLKFGDGRPPPSISDLERLKHSEIQVASPIDIGKWNEAKWRAVFFMTIPDAPDIPPALCLGFENFAAAAEIFRGLQLRFGDEDTENVLRVAIIRGLLSSNPHAYAVSVGPNIEAVLKEGATTVQLISRIQVMTPAGPENLDRFLAEYSRHGCYAFGPASIRNGVPTPMMDLAIGKYELVVRNAWEIGFNDQDMNVLDLEDPPFIPTDQPDAPVINAISRLREWDKKKSR